MLIVIEALLLPHDRLKVKVALGGKDPLAISSWNVVLLPIARF